jgi:hypothetical protein
MVADLVHLKLLLYAIGSGKVDAEHVTAAMIPWWTHVQTFMVPLSASPLNWEVQINYSSLKPSSSSVMCASTPDASLHKWQVKLPYLLLSSQ